MKNFTITLFFLLIIASLSAEIAVKSFRKLESDMTARIDAPKKDQNGDVCAIIKVVTTQTGYVWEPDGLGIVTATPKVGEYWLYVPYGAKRLTIKHPQLGVLRDYIYPLPIEKACVYEMVLITGRIETTVIEEIAKQWLVITPQPEKAMIYIDDVFVAKGEYQAQLSPGTYNYRVEAPLYHTEAGKLEISDTKKELKVSLKPAFGYLNINTTPEAGATIIIDGKELTKTTPATSEVLSSGEHSVQVIKEMYQPATQKVTVTDNQTTPVNLTLIPNFAELSITSPQQASILINGQLKGKGSWGGRLSAGIYSVEAQMDKHRAAKQDIQLAIGDKKEISLQPTPIYGSLNIVTIPSGATISINGKEYGTTPNTIKNLMIGDYELSLNKTGFASVNKTLTVIEGKSIEVYNELLNSGSLKIKSNPSNAYVYIDGKLLGKTPLNAELAYNIHKIEIVAGDKTNSFELNFTNESESELNIDLYECNSTKFITSQPTSASVLIDGKLVGITPFFYKMLNSEASLILKKEWLQITQSDSLLFNTNDYGKFKNKKANFKSIQENRL